MFTLQYQVLQHDSQTSYNLVSFEGRKDKPNHIEVSLTTVPRFNEDKALVSRL